MTEEITQEPESEEVETVAEEEAQAATADPELEPTDETPEEINWKKFREARKRDRQEAQEANRRAEEEAKAREAMQSYVADMLQGMGAKGQLSPAQQEQIVEDLDDGDIPTGGEIKAYVRRQIENGVKNALKQQEKIQEAQSLPARVAETMPDFDQVCTQENTDYLEHIAPTLARALSRPLQDKENVTYSDLKAIYEAVVKMVPNAKAAAHKKVPEAKEDRPRSASTTVANQGRDSAPMMMSDELRQQRYKEMMQAARGMS